jgi:hypothetical protein
MYGSKSEVGAFPAHSRPYGLGYADWSIRWWQRLYSINRENNPAIDDSGKNCSQMQHGPVWFLAGTVVSSTVVRVCNIPLGKATLFPIINSERSTAELQGTTDLQLRECVVKDIDQTTNLVAAVDGFGIRDFSRYRILTPPFKVAICDNNFLGQKPGYARMVSDGYWIILKPMSVGQHTIHFSGMDPTLKLDVTYRVSILDFPGLNELVKVGLEEMKLCLPKVCHDNGMIIEESNIKAIEEVLRATIPSLGVEQIIVHEDIKCTEIMRKNISSILRCAVVRAKGSGRTKIRPSDLTNAILDISGGTEWPFC